MSSRLRGLGGSAGWTLADQALSSLSNAGLSIVVARSVGVNEFGTYSVVLLVFTFSIGLSRTLVTDPLVIRFSSSSPADRKAATAHAAGAALVLGLVGSLLCLGAAVVLGGPLGTALSALAVVLPLILVQDTWRYGFFADNRPSAATVNDLLWTVLQFGTVAVLISTGLNQVGPLVLAWGGSAAAAAILGAWQAGVVPSPAQARPWFRTHHQLASRLAADYVINTGAVNLALVLVGSTLGIAALGALRAAQVLLGPLQLLTSGVTAFVLPVFSRRVSRGASIVRPASITAAVVAPISLAWVALLLVLPDAAGQELLGATWDRARDALLPLGAMMVILSLVMGAGLGLKALGRSDLVLRITLVQAPLIILLTWAGAEAGGVAGAAAGLAGAHLPGLLLTWLSLAPAQRNKR
jgi:O-antigen/teichoic acid export membrane protein